VRIHAARALENAAPRPARIKPIATRLAGRGSAPSPRRSFEPDGAGALSFDRGGRLAFFRNFLAFSIGPGMRVIRRRIAQLLESGGAPCRSVEGTLRGGGSWRLALGDAYQRRNSWHRRRERWRGVCTADRSCCETWAQAGQPDRRRELLPRTDAGRMWAGASSSRAEPFARPPPGTRPFDTIGSRDSVGGPYAKVRRAARRVARGLIDFGRRVRTAVVGSASGAGGRKRPAEASGFFLPSPAAAGGVVCFWRGPPYQLRDQWAGLSVRIRRGGPRPPGASRITTVPAFCRRSSQYRRSDARRRAGPGESANIQPEKNALHLLQLIDFRRPERRVSVCGAIGSGGGNSRRVA